MIKLPNGKVCNNLPEQVASNLEDIIYLAETYKNLDEQVATWPEYKAEWDQFEIDYAGWTSTLETYLTNMSSAAVSAIAGQDIAPKTVSQTNANYSLTFNFSSPIGFTVENIYNRFEVINNVLYAIANVKVTNNTGSSVSLQNQISAQAVVYLNAAIAAQIYDFEGTPISSPSISAQAGVCMTHALVSENVNFTNIRQTNIAFYLMHPQSANVLYVGFRHLTAGESLADGSSLFMTARIPLTLI